MHVEAFQGFTNLLMMSGLDPEAHWRILDVGGADVNGSVREQLPSATWTGLDIAPAPGVDIVADAAEWVPDQLFDVVVCTELFEHAERWREIVGVMASALDSAGPQVFMATCASTGRPPHGARGEWGVPYGQFYGNVDPYELRGELENYFIDVHVTYNPSPGDAYAYARGLQ